MSCESPRLEVFAIEPYLEEEINLHSEHVGLLNGVHTSLARLVGNHFLD